MVRKRAAAMALGLCLVGLLQAGCRPAPKTLSPSGPLLLKSGILPFPWWAKVFQMDRALLAKPGGEWSIDFEAEVDLRRFDPKYGDFTHLIVAVQAQLRHDEDGFFQSGSSTTAVTSRFTTTGIPIERFDGWPTLLLLHGKDGTPFEAIQSFPLPQGAGLAAKHKLKGRLTARLPRDAPVGHYEPRLMIYIRLRGIDTPFLLDNFRDNANTQDEQLLPLVAVGDPATPRLPWTILASEHYRGQAGTLPEQEAGKVALCGRSGFPSDLILPPGRYDLRPHFPTIFPEQAVPPVDGGLEVFPEWTNNYLRFDQGRVSCLVTGPAGEADLGTHRMVGLDRSGPELAENEALRFDMSATGNYRVRLSGFIRDIYGRRFEGGGDYRVTIAHPLSFSTSCKPGTSFLVGDAYPAKVNVNPPFPASVEVRVEYYPNSDPERKRTWVAKGKANRFGHFVPYGKPPIIFDEPGEYLSRVTAEFVDGNGRLWMNRQTSSGVIAPRNPVLKLHGTRTFPYNLRLDEDYLGGVKRFSNRPDGATAIFPFKPAFLPDTFPPYDPADTLFIPSNGPDEVLVEPHVSMAISDPELSARLVEAYRIPRVLPPPLLQLRPGPWYILRNVMQISADSAAWFPADAEHADELPIMPVGDGRRHPFAFPEQNLVEAYAYLGVIRPGFPVMTSVFQSEAIGLYWLASPNRFGHHFNAGFNGDLPGDLYRIQAGAVLMDRETGRNYYGAYSAAVAVVKSEGSQTAISPPGARPLVIRAGREHRIFLATDTHDALEVGETMGFGGMVFPAVQADVTWKVTTPSGEGVTVLGKADRLGIVRGRSLVPVDRPGLYRVRVEVNYKDLKGGVVGTMNGAFWHCAVPLDGEEFLSANLRAVERVDPEKGFVIRLTWPKELTKPNLHYGVLMPGQVLDQGAAKPPGSDWEYRFDPFQRAVQFPNLDVRNFATGRPELADTVVFQFFLEAEKAGEKVFDSLRLVLRRDLLFNYRLLLRPSASFEIPASAGPGTAGVGGGYSKGP